MSEAAQMLIMEHKTETPSPVTPSDLKAMRTRLGLTMDELAQLLGGGNKAEHVRNMEKSRTWFSHQGHLDLLSEMEDAFDEHAQAMLDGLKDGDFLIGYPNDGAFAEYEPDLAVDLRFNSVHRMLLATVQAMSEWTPSIVELVPTQYQEWLVGRSAQDSPDERQRWAAEHRKVYTIRPGMPTATKERT